MRFSFAHIPLDDTRDTVALVQHAERLGFHRAWIPDQTFFKDPYAILAACALQTERIEFGVGITNPYTRHPAATARAIATVDELSEGRGLLALGAGNRKELLGPLGLSGERAATACREAVTVMRALLSGQTVDFKGEVFEARGVALEFGARANLPLYVAARGPLVLQAAGRCADGVIIGGFLSGSGTDYFFANIDKGLQGRERGLGRPQVVAWSTCVVSDDREGELAKIKPRLAHVIHRAPAQGIQAAGIETDRIERIKAAYAAGREAEAIAHVNDALVEAMCIVGDPTYCAARVETLAGRGVDELAILLQREPLSEMKARLDRIAGALMG